MNLKIQEPGAPFAYSVSKKALLVLCTLLVNFLVPSKGQQKFPDDFFMSGELPSIEEFDDRPSIIISSNNDEYRNSYGNEEYFDPPVSSHFVLGLNSELLKFNNPSHDSSSAVVSSKDSSNLRLLYNTLLNESDNYKKQNPEVGNQGNI